MTLQRRERQLIEDLILIHDRQERLAVLVERARRNRPLPAADKTAANRVPGCVSPVWLQGEVRAGRIHLRFAAEAPVVSGLVGLLCEVYQGATLQEAAETETTLFDELELTKDLSPTRKHGLAAVRARIRELARRGEPERGE